MMLDLRNVLLHVQQWPSSAATLENALQSLHVLILSVVV